MGWLDDYLGYGSQIASDVGGSLWGAVSDPFQSRLQTFQSAVDPYSDLSPYERFTGAGSGFLYPVDVVSNIFGQVQKPVNIAAGYYSDLPSALDPNVEPPSISQLGGGSLRDLVEKGLYIPGMGQLPEVTNPYALQAVEKIGGEFLEELSDPTNIPGALIGAGSMAGRAATGLDRVISGMGAISGLGGGLQSGASALGKIPEQGFSPEVFGGLLESGIGLGFGGLSAAGLGAPSVSGPPMGRVDMLMEVPPATPEFEDSNFGPLRVVRDMTASQIMAVTGQSKTMNGENVVTGERFITDIDNGVKYIVPENKFETAAKALPFQYDPTRLGVGLGGFGEGPKVTPEPEVTPEVDPLPEDIFATIPQTVLPFPQKSHFQNWLEEVTNAPSIAPPVTPIDPTNPFLGEPTGPPIVEPPTPAKVIPFRNAENVLNQAIETEGLDSVLEKLGIEDLTPVDQTLVDEMMKPEGQSIYDPEFVKPPGQLVFHGSPYTFDQFDLEKMGTGEGGQAFGPGFYFAENPEVARSYGQNLGQPNTDQKTAKDVLIQFDGDKSKAIEYLNREIEVADQHNMWAPQGTSAEIYKNSLRESIKHIENDTYNDPRGKLYATEIPSGEQFIDYDKPLGQQDPNIEAKVPLIQKAKRFEDNLTKAVHDIEGSLEGINKLGFKTQVLESAIKDYNSGNKDALAVIVDAMDSINQQGIYKKFDAKTVTQLNRLAQNISEAWTAARPEGSVESIIRDPDLDPLELAESGVKGIKYLDRASRGEGAGTRNYVVFDPKDIQIKGRTTKLAKEELSTFVSQMKEEYGKGWRKELTEGQQKEFGDLQLAAVTETPISVPTQTQPISSTPPTVTPTPISTTPAVTPTQAQSIISNQPPTTPPATTSGGPKTPKSGGKLQSLSILERMTLPTLTNLMKANPKIGKRIKAYDNYHTILASQNIANIRETTAGVNKAGMEKIVRFLDGEKGVRLDKHEAGVAQKLREVLDSIAVLADENGVLVGYRQGYFPRKYEDRFEWETSPRSFGTKNAPYGHLEKSRKGNRMNFRRDFKVLEEYINEATRRISEAKYLGKDLSKVTGKAFRGERPTVEYVEKAIGRVTGRERSSTPSRFADRLRKITALTDLGFAALYQPGQVTHTASTVGLRRSLRAAVQTFSAFPKEVLQATRSGALWPNISHEVSKAIGDKGYMHGIPTLDKVMRVHANVAGRLLAQDAKRGNGYAIKQIENLGLKLDDIDLEMKAGRAVSDKTQFRTGTLDLPLWSQSPLGKLATQYSSFAYAHSKFIGEMFKHPIRNFGQMARFAAIGALAGEGVSDLRESLKALIPGDDEDDDIVKRAIEAAAGDESFDDKDWNEKLRAVGRSGRVPITSPAWRVLQNLSMVGGVGIFQNILEKVADRDYAKVLIGPAGSFVTEGAQAVQKDIAKTMKEEELSYRNVGRFGLQNLPIPLVSGRKLAEENFPPERKGQFKISPPKLNLPRVRGIS